MERKYLAIIITKNLQAEYKVDSKSAKRAGYLYGYYGCFDPTETVYITTIKERKVIDCAIWSTEKKEYIKVYTNRRKIEE